MPDEPNVELLVNTSPASPSLEPVFKALFPSASITDRYGRSGFTFNSLLSKSPEVKS